MGLSNITYAGSEYNMRLLIISGTLIVICLMALLFFWGWSAEVAWSGFFYSLLFILLLYNFSAVWRSAQLGSIRYAEMWHPYPVAHDTDLLIKTIRSVSEFNSGNPGVSSIVVYEPATTSLMWMLRSQD